MPRVVEQLHKQRRPLRCEDWDRGRIPRRYDGRHHQAWLEVRIENGERVASN